MTPFRRLIFVGNHLPRQCGIATFTHGVHDAVAAARPDLDTGVVAMTAPELLRKLLAMKYGANGHAESAK